MSLTLSAADIADLTASSSKRNRVVDPVARELAKATKENAKRAALQAAQDAAARYLTYSESELARIDALRAVHWPRARAMRDARASVQSVITAHFDKRDDTVSLSQCELYDLIFREWRLSKLVTRAYAASARIGAFPVSLADMRTDRASLFLGSAAKRHFTFAGGRDWGSAEFDPADIVQGAFIRAIESGDTVNGIPVYGAMFRHVQAERAHLTNMANAEYSARKRAALGWISDASERDRLAEFPETKHTLRLLDTRDYATTSDHRKALAIAHRNEELATLDDAVTDQARKDEVGIANAGEFHVKLANLLMAGHTLAAIGKAMTRTPESLAAEAVQSREDSLRRMSTGIDHSQRSVDMTNAAERDHEIDTAQARHAETLRARRVAAETAHYAMSRAS